MCTVPAALVVSWGGCLPGGGVSAFGACLPGEGLSAQGGVSQTPPCGQNDRPLWKHNLSATTVFGLLNYL